MVRLIAIAALSLASVAALASLASCGGKRGKPAEQVHRESAKPPAIASDPWANTRGSGMLCVGTATPDVPADVTGRMSLVAPGVKVYQLTGLDQAGKPIVNQRGQVIWNYITNVDVVSYTALNPPSFIVNTDGVKAKTIRADHQGAQVVGTLFGLHLRVSDDGTLIAQSGNHRAQPGDKSAGADIFVTDLAADGTCASAWVTHQNFVPATSSGASGIPLTNPSWDEQAGKYLIAYAPGGGNSSTKPYVYSVYADGSASPYTAMEPADNCPGFLYHKTRMDYRWPYLVFLQRESSVGGHVCGDLMDLRTGLTIEYGDGTGGTDRSQWRIYYNHDDQYLDGQTFIMEASKATGGMAKTILLDSAGHFIEGSNRPRSLTNPRGYEIINAVLGKRFVQAEWCDPQPNGAAICTSGSKNATGGIPNLPPGCYPAYATDAIAYRFLTCTDGAKTGAYEGLAAIRYAYTDASGSYHALFRSDRTGAPQVYEVVYR